GAMQGMTERELADAAAAYDDIARPIRTYMPLETLLTLCRQHESLYEKVLETLDSATQRDEKSEQSCELLQKSSCRDEQKGVHSQTTNHLSSDKSDTVAPRASGFRGSVVRPMVPKSQGSASGKVV